MTALGDDGNHKQWRNLHSASTTDTRPVPWLPARNIRLCKVFLAWLTFIIHCSGLCLNSPPPCTSALDVQSHNLLSSQLQAYQYHYLIFPLRLKTLQAQEWGSHDIPTLHKHEWVSGSTWPSLKACSPKKNFDLAFLDQTRPGSDQESSKTEASASENMWER